MKKQNSDILIYQTEDGQTKVQVRLRDETVWLSLNQMAELFQRDKSVISRHIRNIFKDGELLPETTIRKYRILQKGEQKQTLKRLSEGKKKPE